VTPRRLRPEAEVREGHHRLQQQSLEERLLRKCGKTAEEAANNAAQGPFTDARSVLEIARRTGASDLMGQLSRMEEADRCIQLAWESGFFDECWLFQKGIQSLRRSLAEDRLEETRARLKAKATELLAEQYGDLHVKVPLLKSSWDVSQLRKCPIRTLGGPERV
jgi:hypothetical protein